MKSIGIVLTLSLGSVAFADPVLDRVTSSPSKSRRLDVTIEATLGAPGELAVTGDVNGEPVALRRRVRAGSRKVTFHVDARKLGLRKLTTNLEFSLDAAARETAPESAGLEVTQHVTATIPVPCILLPGFGNETTPGGFAPFATAVNLAANGLYTVTGRHPSLIVREYASQTQSLANLGLALGGAVRNALRGSVFQKVDLVGYSYGGLVARSYLAQAGGDRVRNCVFLGTPNEGTPLAYLAVGLSDNAQFADLLGANADLASLAQQFLTDDAKGALRNMYPTYSWATGEFLGVEFPLTNAALELVLGSSATPLTALNNAAPPAGVSFHAFFYTSTGMTIGTVDHLNLTSLVGAGTIDPAAVATGSGDGLVPAHSVTMTEFPAWSAALAPHLHDLGAGTHVTLPLDLTAIAGVADILTQ